MKAVPDSSEHYQTAQQKVSEYQVNLDYASKNADAAKAEKTAKAISKVEIAVASVHAYLISLDPDQKVFLGADIIGDNDYHLGVAVQPTWNLADQKSQEFFLTEMGKSWQELRSPSDPKKAMLFVIDISNQEVLGRYDAAGPHIMD